MSLIVAISINVVTTYAIKITKLEVSLKIEILLVTIVMSLVMLPTMNYVLPNEFTYFINDQDYMICTPWRSYLCFLSGLWSCYIIGLASELCTSNAYSPVKNLAEACLMGEAPNIILGLALGYMSTVIPILCLSISIYVSISLGGIYGSCLASMGMLGCLPIYLSITGSSHISPYI